MIGFPIYLTRILSSMLCGLITIAVLFVELHFYNINCLEYMITCLGKWSYTVNIIFFSGVFFIGELVTGVAEILVFDPMFSNARKTCDTEGKLENVAGSDNHTPAWISWLFSYGRSTTEARTIKFRDMIEFSKNDSATFALSEMYFNIHRILGGLFIVFLLLLLVFPLILWIQGYHLTCGKISGLIVGNLFLSWFSFTQAWRQRMFANCLIFYRSRPAIKRCI